MAVALASLAAGGTAYADKSTPSATPTALPSLSDAPEAETSPTPTPPASTPTPQPSTTLEPPSPSEYDPAADRDPEALTAFRDTLAPYGTWEDHATYGVVWMPSSAVVGADFAPYVSHGHWGLAADNSWLWMSDFSWGWAPFHYGRWLWIGGRGWGWIPGRVYSPAWVVWRTGFYDDYYVGWAPMPPTWYWRGGFASRLWYMPPAPYVFCSASYMFAPHVRMHIAPPHRVNLIAPRTQPYVAAQAGVVGAAPSVAAMTRGPSMTDAHVPVSSIPAQRAAHDPRAVSFARSQTATNVGSMTQGGQFSRTPGSTSLGSTVYTTRPASPGGGFDRPAAPGTATPGPLPPTPRAYSPTPVSPPFAPSTSPAPAMPSPYTYSRPFSPPPVYSRPATPDFSRPSAAPPSYSRPSAAPPSYSRPSGPPSGGFSRPSAPSGGGGGYSRPGGFSPSSPSRPSSGGGSYSRPGR